MQALKWISHRCRCKSRAPTRSIYVIHSSRLLLLLSLVKISGSSLSFSVFAVFGEKILTKVSAFIMNDRVDVCTSYIIKNFILLFHPKLYTIYYYITCVCVACVMCNSVYCVYYVRNIHARYLRFKCTCV